MKRNTRNVRAGSRGPKSRSPIGKKSSYPIAKKIKKLRLNTLKKESKKKQSMQKSKKKSKLSSLKNTVESSNSSSSVSSSKNKSSSVTITNTDSSSMITTTNNLASVSQNESSMFKSQQKKSKRLDERILSTVELINESICRSKITAKNFTAANVSEFNEKSFVKKNFSKKKNKGGKIQKKRNFVKRGYFQPGNDPDMKRPKLRNNYEEDIEDFCNTEEKMIISDNLGQISKQFKNASRISASTPRGTTSRNMMSNDKQKEDLDMTQQQEIKYQTMDCFRRSHFQGSDRNSKSTKKIITQEQSMMLGNSRGSTHMGKPEKNNNVFFFQKTARSKEQLSCHNYNRTISSIKSITKSVKKDRYMPVNLNKERKKNGVIGKQRRFSQAAAGNRRARKQMDKIDLLLEEELSGKKKRGRDRRRNPGKKGFNKTLGNFRKKDKVFNRGDVSDPSKSKSTAKLRSAYSGSRSRKPKKSKRLYPLVNSKGDKLSYKSEYKSRSPMSMASNGRKKKVRVNPANPDYPDSVLEIPDALSSFHIHFDKCDLSSIYIKPNISRVLCDNNAVNTSRSYNMAKRRRRSTMMSNASVSNLGTTSRSRSRHRRSPSTNSNFSKKMKGKGNKYNLSELAHGNFNLQTNQYLAKSIPRSKSPMSNKSKSKSKKRNMSKDLKIANFGTAIQRNVSIPRKNSSRKSEDTDISEEIGYPSAFSNCLSFKSFGIKKKSLKRLPKIDDNTFKNLIFGDEEDNPLDIVSCLVFKPALKVNSPIKELYSQELDEESSRDVSPLDVDFGDIYKKNKKKQLNSIIKVPPQDLMEIKRKSLGFEETSTKKKYSNAFKNLIKNRTRKKIDEEVKVKKVESTLTLKIKERKKNVMEEEKPKEQPKEEKPKEAKGNGRKIRDYIKSKKVTIESSEEKPKLESQEDKSLGDHLEKLDKRARLKKEEESFHKELFSKKIKKYEQIDFLDQTLSERKSLNKSNIQGNNFGTFESHMRTKQDGDEFVAVNMKDSEEGEEGENLIDFQQYYQKNLTKTKKYGKMERSENLQSVKNFENQPNKYSLTSHNIDSHAKDSSVFVKNNTELTDESQKENKPVLVLPMVEKADHNNLNSVKMLPDMKLRKPGKARSDKTISSINSELLGNVLNRNFGETETEKEDESENFYDKKNKFFYPSGIENKVLLMKKAYNPMRVITARMCLVERDTNAQYFTSEDAIIETDTLQFNDNPIYDEHSQSIVIENSYVESEEEVEEDSYKTNSGNFEGVHGVREISCVDNYEIENSEVCEFDQDEQKLTDRTVKGGRKGEIESYGEVDFKKNKEDNGMMDEGNIDHIEENQQEMSRVETASDHMFPKDTFMDLDTPEIHHPYTPEEQSRSETSGDSYTDNAIPEVQESNYDSTPKPSAYSPKVKDIHIPKSNLIQSEKIAEFELITTSSKPTNKICLSTGKRRISKSNAKSFLTNKLSSTPNSVNKKSLNEFDYMKARNMNIRNAQPEFVIKAMQNEEISISGAASTSQKSSKLMINSRRMVSSRVRKDAKKFKILEEKVNVGSLKSTEIIGHCKLTVEKQDNISQDTSCFLDISSCENYNSNSTKSQNDKKIAFSFSNIIIDSSNKKTAHKNSDAEKRDQMSIQDINPFSYFQSMENNPIPMIEEVRASLEVDRSKSDMSLISAPKTSFVAPQQAPKKPVFCKKSRSKSKKKLMLKSSKQKQKEITMIISKENPVDKLQKARSLSKETSFDFNLSADITHLGDHQNGDIESLKLDISPLETIRSRFSPMKSENEIENKTFDVIPEKPSEESLKHEGFDRKESLFFDEHKDSYVENSNKKNYKPTSTIQTIEMPNYDKSPKKHFLGEMKSAQNTLQKTMKCSNNLAPNSPSINLGHSSGSKVILREMKEERFGGRSSSNFNNQFNTISEGFNFHSSLSPNSHQAHFFPMQTLNNQRTRKRRTMSTLSHLSCSKFRKPSLEVHNGSVRRTDYTLKSIPRRDNFSMVPQFHATSSSIDRVEDQSKKINYGKMIARSQIKRMNGVRLDFESEANHLELEYEFEEGRRETLRENSDENPLYWNYKKKFSGKGSKDGEITPNPILKKCKFFIDFKLK